jgi:hypothetical protein
MADHFFGRLPFDLEERRDQETLSPPELLSFPAQTRTIEAKNPS